MAKSKDGIEYMEPGLFFSKENYPLGEILSRGHFGTIYHSGENVIKKFNEEEGSLFELIKELNYYSSYVHDCIMKPLAWTIESGIGYLAMPKGENIQDAYEDGKITIREIISDTLSAVAFLNMQGIAHGDLKIRNMVYHDKKAKLIDFGLAKKAILGSDRQYHITGMAYSHPYTDIEYYSFQQNNIKCELYSLAMCYAALLYPRDFFFGTISYTQYEHEDADIRWLLEIAGRLQENRPSISEVIKQAPRGLIVRSHTGILFSEPDITENKSCGSDLGLEMHKVIRIAYAYNYKMETLFLILHLLHRIYYPLLQEYATSSGTSSKNKEEVTFHIGGLPLTTLEGEEKLNKNLIVAAAITLIGTVMREEIITLEKWAGVPFFKGIGNIVKRQTQTITDILRLTQGILITLTYWDYAKSKEDLLPLLKDTINCKYNPKKIRIVSSGLDKCIRVRNILTLEQLNDFNVIGTVDMFKDERALAVEISSSEGKLPCQFNIGADVTEIERLWGIEEGDIPLDQTLTCVLLRNRKALSLLKLDLALKIYETYLNRGARIDEFILDTICVVDWKKEKYSVINMRKHPFKKVEAFLFVE